MCFCGIKRANSCAIHAHPREAAIPASQVNVQLAPIGTARERERERRQGASRRSVRNIPTEASEGCTDGNLIYDRGGSYRRVLKERGEERGR